MPHITPHLPLNNLNTFTPPHRNHDESLQLQLPTKVMMLGAGATLIAANVVILAVYLNTAFQNTADYKVDIYACTCDCWDRKFKGGYNAEGWRNVWFQMRPTVAVIWIITIFYYTMLLKFTESALTLALKSIGILKGPEKLRWHVLAASCLNFYGQFYCWWATLMYLNDAKPDRSFNRLFYTQIFFNITDLCPALSLYLLLTRGAHISPLLLNTSISIAFVHIILSLWDQGLYHILSLKGAVVRDIMFVVSDLAALAVFLRASNSMFLGNGFRIQIALCILWFFIYFIIKTWVGYDE